MRNFLLLDLSEILGLAFTVRYGKMTLLEVEDGRMAIHTVITKQSWNNTIKKERYAEDGKTSYHPGCG